MLHLASVVNGLKGCWLHLATTFTSCCCHGVTCNNHVQPLLVANASRLISFNGVLLTSLYIPLYGFQALVLAKLMNIVQEKASSSKGYCAGCRNISHNDFYGTIPVDYANIKVM